jgi:hypothetical protein
MYPPDKKELRALHRMYVLHLWRDGPVSPWRASVKAVAEGKEMHFASLENLCVFLQTETAPEAEGPRRTQP